MGRQTEKTSPPASFCSPASRAADGLWQGVRLAIEAHSCTYSHRSGRTPRLVPAWCLGNFWRQRQQGTGQIQVWPGDLFSGGTTVSFARRCIAHIFFCMLWTTAGRMSDEIDKPVLRRYEVAQKLGKGAPRFLGCMLVRLLPASLLPHSARRAPAPKVKLCSTAGSP